jgi:formylglycine-generating enzyme required for sulfatase activity
MQGTQPVKTGEQAAGWGAWRGWAASRWSTLCWALGLAALLAPGLAQAKRVALVIGNGNYTVESKLANPVNDAQLMTRTLKGLGFTVEEKANLPKRDMELAIARFVRESAGADSAVFYYAGHGAQPLNGGRNYLLPVDARVEGDDTLDTDGIVADRIVEQLERSANPPKLRLVILDACRNNRLAGKARSSVRGLARMTPGDDYTLIAFSTNDQDVALDGTGANSPYAQALATHLGRANELPLRRIFELTAEDVRRATQQKQRPRTYGDLDSRARLDGTLVATARVEPAMPPPGPTAEQIEQQAWDAAQRANSVPAYNAYLAEYPRGRFASLARVAVAGLQPQPQPQTPPPAPATLQAGQVFKDCDACPQMVVIPSGNFTMGSSAAEQALAKAGGMSDSQISWESPQHNVNVRSFAAGRYAVTKGEFAAFVRARNYQTEAERSGGCFVWTGSKFEQQADKNWRNVGFAQGDDHPVVCVSWNDAQEYAKWVSQQSGKSYRLLTEAEREYAARGGSQTAFWWGDSINTGQANYNGNRSYNGSPTGEYRQATVAVGSFRPNPFGLYNVHGNVWEWVEDCFHENFNGAPTDGSAWTTNCTESKRVLRGGSWSGSPAGLRSANRIRNTPDLRVSYFGFRLARTVF